MPSVIFVGEEPWETICIDRSLMEEVAKKCM
jgi:hypothetical protein